MESMGERVDAAPRGQQIKSPPKTVLVYCRYLRRQHGLTKQRDGRFADHDKVMTPIIAAGHHVECE